MSSAFPTGFHFLSGLLIYCCSSLTSSFTFLNSWDLALIHTKQWHNRCLVFLLQQSFQHMTRCTEVSAQQTHFRQVFQFCTLLCMIRKMRLFTQLKVGQQCCCVDHKLGSCETGVVQCPPRKTWAGNIQVYNSVNEANHCNEQAATTVISHVTCNQSVITLSNFISWYRLHNAIRQSKLHATEQTSPCNSYADNWIMHLCDMHLSKVAFHWKKHRFKKDWSSAMHSSDLCTSPLCTWVEYTVSGSLSADIQCLYHLSTHFDYETLSLINSAVSHNCYCTYNTFFHVSSKDSTPSWTFFRQRSMSAEKNQEK